MTSPRHGSPQSGQPGRCVPAPPVEPAERLVWADPAMEPVLGKIDKLARRDCTVLLTGETGTGKEMAARAIHAASERAGRPFVPVDCTALPAALVESQLFGHVRGAFTGADQPALGFIRAADGGTLFLDEIGELPAAGQAKLLRCLQQRTVTPVGAVQPIPVDIRIIAATHRNLAQLVEQHRFREDLRYRLEVIAIQLPPLRHRPGDIVPLAEHFLERLARRFGEPPRRLSPAVVEILLRCPWPGNVRQLANAMEHAAVFADGPVIGPQDLPDGLQDLPEQDPTLSPALPTLSQVERQLITQALQLTGGNQSRAARLIQVERHRLRRKILQHGLEHLLHRRTLGT